MLKVASPILARRTCRRGWRPAGAVAQLAEPRSHNPKVVGSILACRISWRIAAADSDGHVAGASHLPSATNTAAIAQVEAPQTEDLKVPGSIPGLGVLRMNSS